MTVYVVTESLGPARSDIVSEYLVVCTEPHMPYVHLQEAAICEVARFKALSWDSEAFCSHLPNPKAHVLMVDCRRVDSEILLKASNLLMVVQYGWVQITLMLNLQQGAKSRMMFVSFSTM
ncbi:MAG: hypothetical protein AB1576_13310 [Bacillota bacterium]